MEQQKVFNWVKAQLATNGIEVDTIVEFTKGDILAKLFGVIAKKRVDKIIANPKIVIEHIQNLNVALTFAKNELQLRNLNFTAEAFMDPSIATSTKAAWSVLSMLYKKYASPSSSEESECPLLDWARSILGRDIPSLKSMKDGRAFLAIINKLCVDESLSESTSHTNKPNNNNNNNNNNTIEYDNISTINYDNNDSPSDPVELSLFLTSKYFGIIPPIPASEISSGCTSSILSFLTLLHNVAVMRLTKSQFEEDNMKKHLMIQSLREDNARLELENAITVQEVEVMNEVVITEKLDDQRMQLKVDLIEIQQNIAELSEQNKTLKEEQRNKERERIERALQCKFKFETHVFHLRNFLDLAGNSAAISDIQDNLIAIRQSMIGSEEEQLNELYMLIQAENEKILFLEEQLREKAEEEKACEERKRAERQLSKSDGLAYIY